MVRGEKPQKADHAIVETGTDPVASAGATLAHQAGAYPDRAIKPGDKIGDRRASTQRSAAGLAGNAHKPAHCLGDKVEGWAVAIRPAIAKTRKAADDQTRIERLEPGLVEPHRREHAGPIILDQHIAFLDEPRERRAAFVMAQVQGQRLLVAIERG